MTEVLSSSEEISIDDEAVWEAIRPGSGFKKCIKSMNEEPYHVDALSDKEEECSSRPSSPEVEILEVSKNKSHITVDLTLDDDDSDCDTGSSGAKSNVNGSFQDKNDASISTHTSKSTPVLDISDDEMDVCQGGMQEEVAILSAKPGDKNPSPMLSPSFPCSAFRNEIGESYIKKPKLAWSSKFNEEDTMSLMQKLESYANLPKISTKQEGLDFSGSRTAAPASHESISFGSMHVSSVASSSQDTSSSSSYSQNFYLTDNHVPVINSSSAVSAVSQPLNIPQATSSDGNQSSSLFITPGRMSPSLCYAATYSVPGYEDTKQTLQGYEDTRQTNNLQNSFITNGLSNRNHDPSDLLVLSLLEAELPSDFKITNSNSAFQTVSPGTARPVSSNCTSVASNSVPAATPGTSDVLWNGGQSSTSTSGNGIFVYASDNSWKPVSVSNADVLGLGEFSDSLQFGFKCPVTQSVNSVTYNGSLDGNSLQGLPILANSGLSSNASNPSWCMASSSNGDYRQWSPSDFIISQQSVVSPVQENANFVSSSQSSVINVPTPVDLSSSSSNLQPSDLVQTTEDCASVLPIYSRTNISEQTSNHVESNIYSATYGGTLSQPPNFGETKDDDHKLDDKIASKTSADSYVDPPSPEGPNISCHICLDSVKTIQSSSRQLCSTVCGHVFCSECLEASLKQKKECPMCRKRLNKNKYHPLFV